MTNKYKLGDRVWYEAEDGNRYLMVVKKLHDYALALYPHDATRLTLKDTSESKYSYIGNDKVSLATAVTEDNLFMANQVAKTALDAAIRINNEQGHPLSAVQGNLIKQSIVHSFLQEKQKRFLLEQHGLI